MFEPGRVAHASPPAGFAPGGGGNGAANGHRAGHDPADRAGHDPADRALDVARLVAELLDAGQPDVYRLVIQAVDRVVLTAALGRFNGNQVKASDRLGISRTTLRTKLQALGLLSDRHARPAPREPHDPVADR